MSSACRSVLAKIRVLGTSSAREDVGEQPVLEGFDDEPDLIFGDDVAVEVAGGVGDVVIELFVDGGFGAAVAVRDEEFGFLFEFGSFDGDFGEDGVDVKANVDVVSDGVSVSVFGDEVLVEEAEGLFGGGGGEPNDEGVEVVEDLSPLVVDAAVAFVDDDEVEGAERRWIVVMTTFDESPMTFLVSRWTGYSSVNL